MQLYTTNHCTALVEFFYPAVRITLGVVAQIISRAVYVPGSQRCGFYSRHYCHTQPKGKPYLIQKGSKNGPKRGFIFPASQPASWTAYLGSYLYLCIRSSSNFKLKLRGPNQNLILFEMKKISNGIQPQNYLSGISQQPFIGYYLFET